MRLSLALLALATEALAFAITAAALYALSFPVKVIMAWLVDHYPWIIGPIVLLPMAIWPYTLVWAWFADDDGNVPWRDPFRGLRAPKVEPPPTIEALPPASDERPWVGPFRINR